MVLGLAQIRHLAIITVIDDEFYDICNTQFVNFKRSMIIHYCNLTDCYNDEKARIKLFLLERKPQTNEDVVLLDVDDEPIISQYENMYLNQPESDDLTY